MSSERGPTEGTPRRTVQLLLTPRAVNSRHGTGVQIRYFQQFFPDSFLTINFGGKEFGVEDHSELLESRIASCWPFRYRGRQLWSALCERFRIGFWSKHQLNEKGKDHLCQLTKEVQCGGMIGIVSDEISAKRFFSLQQSLNLPFSVILYDWVPRNGEEDDSNSYFAKCIRLASHVYAISKPLEIAAKALGAGHVSRIGFYRPKPNLSHGFAKQETSTVFKIFVLSHAQPVLIAELIEAVKSLASSGNHREIEIHIVGAFDKEQLSLVPSKCAVVYHGMVSSDKRDEIGQGCDIAYLAGPAKEIDRCPFAKYSVPSKLGDFAALGLPVLARLSEQSAAHQFISEELSGFAIVSLRQTETATLLESLLSDHSLLKQMALEALAYSRRSVVLPNAILNLGLF